MGLVPANYRPRTIRGIIVALLNEFQGLKVENFTNGSGGAIINEVDVPIGFGHMTKYHQIIRRDQQANQVYQPLPKMALTWDSIVFAGDRARGLKDMRKFYDTNLGLSDIDGFLNNLNPKPWNLGFSLDIRTESLNHFTQLMENILPYFDPARYLRVKEFSFLNIERNLKVRLEGVSQDFLTEVTEDGISYVRGQLQLSVEAFLMVPELTNAKLIKEIRTRYYPQGNADVSAYGGNNTSGWASSADFTGAYDTSGYTSAFGNPQEFNFDVYFKDFLFD